MAIDLNDLADITPQPITTQSETITTEVEAGKTLAIGTTSPVNVIAEGTVPEGKKWTVQWIVCITETDV